MLLTDAIMGRRSIRGFQKRPVSKETLTLVLALATRAVSAANLQPWEFVVVAGEPLKALRADNVDCLRSGAPADFRSTRAFGVYRQRQVAIAKKLFAAAGVAREDRERRDWWTEGGFRFFDAPAVILLYIDKSLDETACRFDLGCVTRNICLAAMEFGLGTCVENQAILYFRGIRKYLQIPPGKRMEAGIAIGYPDDSFASNVVVSDRDGRLEVLKEDQDANMVIGIHMPCVVTFTKPSFDPRYPTIKRKMAANRTQIPTLGVEDLTEIDAARIGLKGSPTHVKKSFVPQKKSGGLIVKEETVEQSASKLISLLSNAHVI